MFCSGISRCKFNGKLNTVQLGEVFSVIKKAYPSCRWDRLVLLLLFETEMSIILVKFVAEAIKFTTMLLQKKYPERDGVKAFVKTFDFFVAMVEIIF